MVARFRDEHYKTWIIDKLLYWDRSEVPWHRDDGYCYERCQVYDAPDPGEGWRLIDIETEKPQDSDEFYSENTSKWFRRDNRYAYNESRFYRRRIEQPKPEPKYVPFEWEDREQLRGRWIVDRLDDQEWLIDTLQNLYGKLWICGRLAEHFLTWEFADTGEPVGRKVE